MIMNEKVLYIHIVSIKEEKGFMFCSMINNKIINGEYLLIVYASSSI